MEMGKTLQTLAFLMIFTLSSIVIAFDLKTLNIGYSSDTVGPVVSVTPSVLQIEVGQNFTINVEVENLTDTTAPDPDNPLLQVPCGNLYGVDLQLGWDPTVIHCVSYQKKIPVETYADGVMHSPSIPVKNDLDESASMLGSEPGTMYWLAEASMLPAAVFNGNGNFVTMTFNVLKEGESPIKILGLTMADISAAPIGRGSSNTWLRPPENATFSTPTSLHKPTITRFSFGYYMGGTNLTLPVIDSENTTVQINVKNDGNVADAINVTLFANSSAISTWLTSVLAAGETEEINWQHAFSFGYYNLTVLAETYGVTSVEQGYLRVVKPPSLSMDYNPKPPMVGEIITFNASASSHQDPEGEIVHYAWRIYAPNMDPAVDPPNATFAGDNLTAINYTFDEAGDWTIVLVVTDNFHLTYDEPRLASAAYRITVPTTIIPEFSSVVSLLALLASTAVIVWRKKKR